MEQDKELTAKLVEQVKAKVKAGGVIIAPAPTEAS